MAGAGYKLFNTGDVLTAAQVNTYLQEQTVMVFANSTARTTALSGVLAEGMVSYLQDTNAVEVYNGSAWVGVSGAGDVTEVQAGTGISVASGTGPIPVVTNTMATAVDAKGDLIVGTGADTFARLAVGTNGYTLVADSSVSPQGLKWAVDPVADVITTAGDLIYGTAADTVARLGIGTAGQVLKVNSGATAPEWGSATAAADSFTLINSGGTSLSGSSVSITGISGKNELAIYIDELSLAGSGDIGIRIQINSDTGTNYWNGVVGRRTSAVFSEAFENATGWYLGAPNASGDTMFIQARISGCNGSGYKFGWWVSSQNGANANNATYVNGQGNWSGSGTISSIQIKCDSSTFDGGTVYVYGA